MVENVFWNKQLFKYFKNEQKYQQSIKQFQLNTISYSKVIFFKTYFFSISISYMQILYDQKQPPEVFYKKVVLRSFTKFTGKHLCQSLFLNKVAGLEASELNTFFTEHLWTTTSVWPYLKDEYKYFKLFKIQGQNKY